MKTQAEKFISQNDLNASNILSQQKLKEIAVKMGFKIYRPQSRDDEIIETLKIGDVFEKQSVFSYAKGNIKYIFVDNTISEMAVAEMMLHEIAHIYLGHLEKSQFPADSDEAEANMFVSEVKSIVYGQHRKVHILSSIIVAMSVLILMLSLHIAYTTSMNLRQETLPASNSEAVTSLNSDTVAQSESVFVTKNGTKYHKADCYHIKDSDVIELTVSEAEEAGYEACKDCF